jgi:hypothetical protein
MKPLFLKSLKIAIKFIFKMQKIRKLTCFIIISKAHPIRVKQQQADK